MKKLMIAAAIVCAAAMVQAASWNWLNASTANYVSSSGELQKTGSFVLMYLGDGVTADWSLASDGNVRDSIDLAFVPSPIPGVVADKNKVVGSYALTTGKDVNDQWFAVMLKDGDEYKQLLDYATGDALAAKQLKGFENPSSLVADYVFASADYTVASVPEPTSGFLLLLGVAGLALRRRRA